jgi:hypothetical protein
VENHVLGADGDAVATEDAALVRICTDSRKSLPIDLEKPHRTYCDAHAIALAGAVINGHQTHPFLLLFILLVMGRSNFENDKCQFFHLMQSLTPAIYE